MPSVAPVGRILLPLLCSVSPEFYYNFTFLNTFTSIHVQYNAENWYILLVVLVNNIESFIEDQAFLPSYELAPPPLFPPLPSASCLSFSVFLCVVVQAYWRERREGVGEEPNHTLARKPCPLSIIQYSLVISYLQYNFFTLTCIRNIQDLS